MSEVAILVLNEEPHHVNIHYVNYHSEELFVVVKKMDLEEIFSILHP